MKCEVGGGLQQQEMRIGMPGNLLSAAEECGKKDGFWSLSISRGGIADGDNWRKGEEMSEAQKWGVVSNAKVLGGCYVFFPSLYALPILSTLVAFGFLVCLASMSLPVFVFHVQARTVCFVLFCF